MSKIWKNPHQKGNIYAWKSDKDDAKNPDYWIMNHDNRRHAQTLDDNHPNIRREIFQNRNRTKKME